LNFTTLLFSLISRSRCFSSNLALYLIYIIQ
jgi:hypothetical protein